jgi:hypothetical protein
MTLELDYNIYIERAAYQLLCNLTTTLTLPNHSLLLAPPPIHSVGLDPHSPSSRSYVHMIMVRSIDSLLLSRTAFLSYISPPTLYPGIVMLRHLIPSIK